ncbi:uncharacterized protein LOC106013560, partial [Aplysia californica]|uniref:Uncharacterized protein LOC106013560 n=1 Tax=Aplysia californica TaxID=6500 RepID=A0ABM1W2V9_APLCA
MRGSSRHQRLCQLRAGFVEEWAHRYSTDPRPPRPPLPAVVRDLADLREADVRGGSATVLGRVGDALSAVSCDISRLREELDRKLFLQNFLRAVISILDSSDKSVACGEGKFTHVGDLRVGRRRDNEDNEDTEDNEDKEGTGKVDRDDFPQLASASPASETFRVGRPVGPKSTDGQGGDREEICPRDRTLVSDVSRPSRPLGPQPRTHDKSVCGLHVRERSVNASASLASLPVPKGQPFSSARPFPPGVEEGEVEEGEGEVEEGEEGEEGNIYDNVLALHPTTYREGLVEEGRKEENKDTMFRRSKGSGKQADDGSDSPPHSLASKDNFLAVTSRRVVLPVGAGRQSDPDSPLLNRHFQMLKMTSGFDLVMGEKGESTDKLSLSEHSATASAHANPSTAIEAKGHSSQAAGDKNSNSASHTFVAKNSVGGVPNSKGKQGDVMTGESSPHALWTSGGERWGGRGGQGGVVSSIGASGDRSRVDKVSGSAPPSPPSPPPTAPSP